MDLCSAAKYGDADYVQQLLTCTDIELSRDELRDALIIAVDERHDHIGELLVNQGAPFDVRLNARHNMLFRAVRLRCINTFKAMLDKNVCKLSARGENDWTLLHMLTDYFSACYGDSKFALEVIDALLRKDIDINSQDKRGCTPLMILMNSSSLPVLPRELLLRKADPNLRDKYGLTALHRACGSDYINAQKIKINDLIEFGAEIDSVDLCGSTPIHLAHPKIIPTLLEHCPNLFIKDAGGSTGLSNAVHSTEFFINKETAEALYLHLKKLEACELISPETITKEYLILEHLCIFNSSFDEVLCKSMDEATLLRQRFIEMDLSLYSFLATPPRHMLSRYNAIDVFFSSNNIEEEFPHLGKLLNKKLREICKIKCRYDLIFKGIFVFSQIEPVLPVLVTEYILNFLTNEELAVLSSV